MLFSLYLCPQNQSSKPRVLSAVFIEHKRKSRLKSTFQATFLMAGLVGLEVASQPRLRCPATRCIRISLADHGTSFRSLYLPPAALATSPGTRFWRSCQIKKTVKIVPTVEPCLRVAKNLIFAYDALLMLLKNLCKFDAQIS